MGLTGPALYDLVVDVHRSRFLRSAKIPPPPGAAVATRRMQVDSRAEPEYGERVPYVLFQSEPGQLQVDKALHPADFIADPFVFISVTRRTRAHHSRRRLRLDAPHYIVAIIKVLERVFILVGADVRSWYAEMPQTKLLVATRTNPDDKRKPVLLDEHFVSDRCAACGGPHGKGGELSPSYALETSLIPFRRTLRTLPVESRRSGLHDHVADSPRSKPSARAAPDLRIVLCDASARGDGVRFVGLSGVLPAEQGRGRAGEVGGVQASVVASSRMLLFCCDSVHDTLRRSPSRLCLHLPATSTSSPALRFAPAQTYCGRARPSPRDIFPNRDRKSVV